MKKKHILNNPVLQKKCSIEINLGKGYFRRVNLNKLHNELFIDMTYKTGQRLLFDGEILNYMRDYSIS